MIMLWNFAFIIGFLPIIGWSDDDLSCMFFHYYNSSYIFFLTGCVSISVVICIAYLVRIQRAVRLRNVRHRLSFIDDIRQYHTSVAEIAIIITRYDLLLNVVFYLPIMLFLALHCRKCPLFDDTRKESRMVLFFYPLILVKGILALFFHAIKTPQIFRILKDLSRCKLSGSLVEHQDSVRSTRTLQSGTSSIYSIARRYSMHLTGTLPKGGTSAVGPSTSDDSFREIGTTSRESFPGICPNCGHKESAADGNTDKKVICRTTSLPAKQIQDPGQFSNGHRQIKHIPDNGHINPVYEEAPSRARSTDIATITGSDIGTSSVNEYRKSFAQTHLFKPQYVVFSNDQNDTKYMPVRRKVSLPINYCPVHGVKFSNQTKANVYQTVTVDPTIQARQSVSANTDI